MNAMQKAHQIRKEAAAKFNCKVSEIHWGECLRMAHKGEGMEAMITYKKKKWGKENTIYDFRIKDAEESLLAQIKGRFEQSAKTGFCPQYTFVRNLVVECDLENKYNPTSTEVARNKEIVELLMGMGAVAV